MDPLSAADPPAVGEFRLLARLGSGGMGQVFLASSLAGRIVAVKVIHQELCRDAEFVRRFRGEVEAAAKVSGWYTAPVVAAGVNDSPPWLATAFVPGPSLEDVVRRYGPLPTQAVWRLAAGLAEALRAIHGTGLIHRDLKPANVLLALDGPRVIDFGISRAVTDTRMTATGVIIGTPSYMSPEQVEGLVAGPASDVFSLGSVLGYAASGSAPFGEGRSMSATSVMYRIVHAEPDLGAIPEHVRELIEACLTKDPWQRADLVRVAARSTAAAERLGLSPAMFWPHEVAKVIQAQQAALTAQIEALQVAPATHLEGNWRANGIAPASPRGAAPEPHDSSLEGAHAIPSHRGVTRGTSRRGLLIGAGVGGVAVIGGTVGWVISTRPAASVPPATGTGHTQPPTGQALPSGGALQPYFGLGPHRTAAWKFPTGNAIEADPGAANGVVYVGSTDNNVYAVSIATRRQVWSFEAGSVSTAPELAGDVVCLSTTDGHFYARHAADGAPAWDVATHAPAYYRRNWTVDGGSVILTTVTAPPQAHDAATGAKGVTFRTSEPFAIALKAAGGVLYALDASGILYAFQAATGTEIWHNPLLSGDDRPGTSLAVDGGSVYLGTISGTLYAIEARTGRILWRYHPGSGIETDLAVADGVVYVKDNNGTLHAVRAATRKPVWKLVGNVTGPYGLTVAGGRLYYTTDLAVQALDAKTGTPVWSFPAPGDAPLLSTPAVASGLVFVGCHNDALYAIQA